MLQLNATLTFFPFPSHPTVFPQIPDDVQDALADPRAAVLTPESSAFWILVSALGRFVGKEGNGQLPLDGSVPDMVGTAELFRELQLVYKAKAAADLAAFTAHVTAVLASLSLPPTHVPEEDVARFCKNCRHLAVLNLRQLSDELRVETANKDEIATVLACSELGDMEPLRWHLALRAVDRFHDRHGRFPGEDDATSAEDVDVLGSLASSIVHELGLDGVPVTAKHVAEMTRFGGVEPHTTAAYIGGIASQEAIKLLTHQFRPMNNTHVFCGVAGTSATYEL